MSKIIFIGAGAIGSYLGGWLSHTGHDVTLVDPWAEQVEAIRTSGLRVTGPHEPFTARPAALHLHEAQQLSDDFDIGFVAMKSYDTEWATHFIKIYLKPQGYVVSAQNCWNDPMIASIVGAERSVGLIMSRIQVALWTVGAVERGGPMRRDGGYDVFRPGEHDGQVSERVLELAQMLSVIDGSKATDNLWGERWAKLSQNAMGNPVTAMSGLGSAEVAARAAGREITIRLAQESAQVGLALGHKVPSFGGFPARKWADAARGDVFEELAANMASQSANGTNWRPSMAQDVIKGRRSEIDQMNGYIVQMGQKTGVKTPVSAAVVQIMRAIDAGRAKPAPANIERALAAAEA